MKTKIIIILLAFIGYSKCITAQYTILHTFADTTIANDGQSSSTDFHLYYDGTYLYGMTTYGGSPPEYSGTIFKIRPDGTGYTILSVFTGINGARPYGSLISDGTYLYGFTSASDSTNAGGGTLFKILPDGTGFVQLFNFDSVNASNIHGTPLSDGTYFYGMAGNGGANGGGIIFKIKMDGTDYTDLYDFNTNSATRAFGSLISDGTYLYGMTEGGGTYYNGNVFKIKTDGTDYTDLLDFYYFNNGKNPMGSLIQIDSFLYGTTQNGSIQVGTIFKIKTDGTDYTELYGFTGSSGYGPDGTLLYDGNYLYGTTQGDGVNSSGNIFKIQTDGTGYADLFDAQAGNNAIDGNAFGCTLITDGIFLYGTSAMGGIYGQGVMFKFQLATTVGQQQSEVMNNEINIYPNPFTSQTTLSFSQEQKNTLIIITDILGNQIKRQTFSGKQCTIEKGEMSNGIYFVRIIDENKNMVNRKIVVQ